MKSHFFCCVVCRRFNDTGATARGSGAYWPALWVTLGMVLIAQAKPLFPNSVVSNDIDFIRADDPTVEFNLSDKGRAPLEFPGSLIERPLVLENAYLMELKYKDGAKLEVWADPVFADYRAASGYAAKIGTALGKLPKLFREKLKHVVVHVGDRVAFSEHEGSFFVLYSANIDKRIATHDLEETCFHETIHATLELDHATSPEWLEAQKKDAAFITGYAAEKPRQEDLPESALFAYALIKHPGRMPQKVEKAVSRIMPNRLDYLRKVFADLEKATIM